MAVEISTAVWSGSQQLEGGRLLVLLRLADWCNVEGFCWPSVPKLANYCRMSVRHVQRIIRELQTEGILEIEDRGAQHKTNYYRIVVEKLADSARVTSEPKGDIEGASRVTSEAPRVTPTPPHPSGEPSIEPSSGEVELKAEAGRFVDWFIALLARTGAPAPRLTPTIRIGWADAYEKLVRIDNKTKGEIAKVCEWARGDAFWRTNFYSPTKLRERKDGISRYDQFLAKLKSPNNGNPTTLRPNGRYFEQAGSYAGITDK